MGGFFGPYMKFAGFDALVIVGKAKDETIIYIDAVNKKIVPTKAVPTGFEHILLVDDDPLIVEMQKKMLEKLGYQVSARTNSREALDAFTAAPDSYDVVITDMTMPDLTGDVLSTKLLELRSELPIIILTGFSTRISKSEADALGIKGYLLKPVTLNELANTVRDILDSQMPVCSESQNSIGLR